MNDKINYKSAQYILGSIGTLGGLYYAFSNKKGALAYVGFALLGGIAGSIIGGLYDNAIKPAVKNVGATLNEVKDDLIPIKTTRPMQPSPVSSNGKYDRVGMPLLQSSSFSAESDAINSQMMNFL